MKKRLLAIFLSAAMAVSLFALPAGAAEGEILWLPEGVRFVSELFYSYDTKLGWLNVALDEDGFDDALYDLNTGTFVEEYDSIGNFSEGLATVTKDGKYGYVDETGKLVVPIEWDCGWDFQNGAAIVMLDQRDGENLVDISYYLIDTHGELIASLGYDIVYDFSEGLALVEWNGKCGYIERDGEVIPCQYDGAGDFSEGLAAVELDGKWGYIDKTGKVVISPQYDGASGFSEGLAAVEIDGKLGYINAAGELVIQPQYEVSLYDDEYDYDYTYDWDFSEGLALVYRMDDSGVARCGFIDKTGKEVIPCQYDHGVAFSYGLAAVELNGKEGFIDKTGQVVVPFRYDGALSFVGDLSAVVVGEYPDWKWGLVDQTGREVVPCEYDCTDYIYDNRTQWAKTLGAYVQKGDRFGLVAVPAAEPTIPAVGTAYPSTQTVDVDGKAIEFQCYALKDEKGNDTNYIKLRDLADILNGTAVQFNVGWDGSVTIATKTAYTTKNGSEQHTPFSGQRTYEASTAATKVNGVDADISAVVLKDDNGGGYTYYQLRDVGKALGFNVGWDGSRGVFLETGKPYDPSN